MIPASISNPKNKKAIINLQLNSVIGDIESVILFVKR